MRRAPANRQSPSARPRGRVGRGLGCPAARPPAGRAERQPQHRVAGDERPARERGPATPRAKVVSDDSPMPRQQATAAVVSRESVAGRRRSARSPTRLPRPAGTVRRQPRSWNQAPIDPVILGRHRHQEVPVEPRIVAGPRHAVRDDHELVVRRATRRRAAPGRTARRSARARHPRRRRPHTARGSRLHLPAAGPWPAC